jgi:hypothetical protein
LEKEATGDGLASILEESEFKICGLWQFIPVCRVPCISVFKNFNKERLEFIKSASVDKKVNYMKASHIPVVWRDAPVPPFRFNPKLDKEAQGKASFVQIKARFNSERDNFEFVSLLGVPTDSPPNYLKAGKKDKLSAAKTKLGGFRKLANVRPRQFQTTTLPPNPRVLPTSLSLSPSPRERASILGCGEAVTTVQAGQGDF